MNDVDLLRRESAAAHTDTVDTGEDVFVRHGNEGRDVLPDQRAALNHRMFADAHPLMHGGMTSYHGPVAHLDLAGQRHAVGKDAVAAHHVIVGDMHIGHQQIVAADHRLAARRRTAGDGHAFADIVVIADLGGRILSLELQILRQAGDRSSRMDFATLADACTVVDDGTRADPAVVADSDVTRYIGKRFYGHVLADHGIGMNVG